MTSIEPQGPPPVDGKPEPAWIGVVAVVLLAAPWLLGIALLLGAFYLCGGSA